MRAIANTLVGLFFGAFGITGLTFLCTWRHFLLDEPLNGVTITNSILDFIVGLGIVVFCVFVIFTVLFVAHDLGKALIDWNTRKEE